MNQDDKYGSVLRERMKESMKESAKFRPTNHPDSCECKLCYHEDPLAFIKGLGWCAAILAGCVIAIGALAGLEQWLKHLTH